MKRQFSLSNIKYIYVQDSIKEHMKILERQLEIIKRRADMWKAERSTDDHVVNIM
jgi:hypothetical protein